VIEHEKWYQEYLDLNEIKKVAIQRWREKKEVCINDGKTIG
jgi:hypothetical protein